jgi:pyrroloquinoline quinone (PQQ) biosynthesis protein C
LNVLSAIESEWDNCFRTLADGEFFRRLRTGGLSRAHYMAFLAEEYHNTTENPRIMALFISHLHTGAHKAAGKLLRHAAQEMGHNDMALADLKVLGGDDAGVRAARPLPATEALAAFISFEIQRRNPKAFLGYLYHMESISLRMAGSAGDIFKNMQIPETALSFLREHAEADPAHMTLNRDYLEAFILDETDLEAVLYGMKGSCLLHGLMFQGILDSVEHKGYFEERHPLNGRLAG